MIYILLSIKKGSQFQNPGLPIIRGASSFWTICISYEMWCVIWSFRYEAVSSPRQNFSTEAGPSSRPCPTGVSGTWEANSFSPESKFANGLLPVLLLLEQSGKYYFNKYFNNFILFKFFWFNWQLESYQDTALTKGAKQAIAHPQFSTPVKNCLPLMSQTPPVGKGLLLGPASVLKFWQGDYILHFIWDANCFTNNENKNLKS